MTTSETNNTQETTATRGGRARAADDARELAATHASPGGGAGRLRRLAHRVLLRLTRPWATHQQGVNSRLIEAIDRLDWRLREQERLQLELVTTDLAAGLAALRERLAELEPVAEAARAVPYSAPGSFEHFRDPFAGVVLGYRDGEGGDGAVYRGFEDVFRGPEERVRESQRVYVDLLAGHEPVLDAGCGRGEFLDLMRERGMEYAGVDLDEGMVAACRAKGHQSVELGTATGYLEARPDGSFGAIYSAQVVEHIPYEDLIRFLRVAHAKLRPGGLLVAETVNPHAPRALKTFWVDPTRHHPLFPEVALVLCRLAGFPTAYVFHPLGSGHVDDDRQVESTYAVVAAKA